MVKSGIFDCHCHTWRSPDSKSEPDSLCQTAIEKGLLGIAFTDHCNVNYWPEQDVLAIVEQSVRDAEQMQKRYGDRLTVLRGVEMGNHAYNPDVVRRVLEQFPLDIVVGSVHCFQADGWNCNIPREEFEAFSDERIRELLDVYYRQALRVAAEEDIDTLAHFGFGPRLMICRENMTVDMRAYWPIIEKTLEQLIRRNIALEMNSNNIIPRKASPGKVLIPGEEGIRLEEVADIDLEIARMYYAMGGRLITLGSDSHKVDRVGRELNQVAAKLKQIGFAQAYYFQNRQPVAYTL